jgi:hypothetical protein
MNGRRYTGQQEASQRKPLTEEQKAKQREKASCFMTIRFHDGNTWSKWSNEWAQPNKFPNISAAVNEMLRIADQYFAGKIYSAAIFDTRTTKSLSAANKIYQYEKGFWKLEKPITW